MSDILSSFGDRQNQLVEHLTAEKRERERQQAAKDAVPVKHLQIAEANLASEFYERLVEWIGAFNATLDDANEVGVRLVNFGEAVTFHLRDMDYFNPSLIKFVGETDSGSMVELIQHVSQISVLLMKLPRKNPDEPKKPMGFHAVHQPEE